MAEKMKRRETGDDDARPSKKFRDGGDAGEEKKPGNDDHKIIVVGLPKNVTDTKLQQMCEGFGTVARAALALDAGTGQSRGFGFVTFDAAGAAASAIAALDQTSLEGRTLNVRAVEERGTTKDKPQSDRQKERKQKERRPCFNYQRGKCKKGMACKFSHAGSAMIAPRGAEAPSTAAGGAARRAGGDDEAATDAERPRVPDGYCVKFQQGRCHRGRACKWKHSKPGEGGDESGEGDGAGGRQKKQKQQKDPKSPKKPRLDAPAPVDDDDAAAAWVAAARFVPDAQDS
jgi:RNA recognition motif-containing protein